MGSQSRRKRVRGDKTRRDRERDFLYGTWSDSWGRPPVVVWWVVWLVGGSVALGGYIGAICVAVTSVIAVPNEGLWALFGLPVAAILALATFAFLWLPLWRFHRYYLAWDLKGKLSAAYQALPENDSESTDDGAFAYPLTPGTPQFAEVVRLSVAAIDRDHRVRRTPQSEFRRAAALLHDVVQPAEHGQIDLVEAFEVRGVDRALIYGIVSYNEMVRDGKRVSRTTGVGQVIFLSLGADLGRIWIRPEGLMDKLGEFVFSRDIDFVEHPRFSRRYLLHAECPDTLERQVPDEFWQAFGEHIRLVAVGKGSTLIVGCEGGIIPEDAAALTALGFRLLRVFGGTG